jgi:hypothetical protein
MAANILRRSSAEAPTGSLTIGDPDGAIFVCPTCSRPIASGARRCAGCGARFVLDVPLQKAVALVSMGLAVGLLVGAGIIGLFAINRSTAAPAVWTGDPSVPGATSAQPGTNPGTVVVGRISSGAAAALRGTATINARMAELAVPLAAEINARDFDASAVARLLRRVSVDVGAAEILLPSLSNWDGAAGLTEELRAFYVDLSTAVRSGLAASIRNQSAYKTAAKRVVAILGRQAELDAAGRELAARAGVSLTP